jgi:hypothetical protein
MRIQCGGHGVEGPKLQEVVITQPRHEVVASEITRDTGIDGPSQGANVVVCRSGELSSESVYRAVTIRPHDHYVSRKLLSLD